MHYNYIIGAGITLQSAFKIDKHCSIVPTMLDSDIDKLKGRALTQKDYGVLCALAETITFELKVSAEDKRSAAIQLWNYQWILVLLAVYGSNPIYWPFQSEQSATEASAIKLTNFFLSNHIFREPRKFSLEELQDCASLWPNFQALLDKENFVHAASIAMTNFNEPKPSIRIAAIWSGIESLLGFDQELRFRIALAVTRLLEKDKTRREKRFSEVKKLYDFRSKCVHGSYVTKKDEKSELVDSLALLRELILFFTRRGYILDSKERELLFLE